MDPVFAEVRMARPLAFAMFLAGCGVGVQLRNVAVVDHTLPSIAAAYENCTSQLPPLTPEQRTFVEDVARDVLRKAMTSALSDVIIIVEPCDTPLGTRSHQAGPVIVARSSLGELPTDPQALEQGSALDKLRFVLAHEFAHRVVPECKQSATIEKEQTSTEQESLSQLNRSFECELSADRQAFEWGFSDASGALYATTRSYLEQVERGHTALPSTAEDPSLAKAQRYALATDCQYAAENVYRASLLSAARSALGGDSGWEREAARTDRRAWAEQRELTRSVLDYCKDLLSLLESRYGTHGDTQVLRVYLDQLAARLAHRDEVPEQLEAYTSERRKFVDDALLALLAGAGLQTAWLRRGDRAANGYVVGAEVWDERPGSRSDWLIGGGLRIQQGAYDRLAQSGARERVQMVRVTSTVMVLPLVIRHVLGLRLELELGWQGNFGSVYRDLRQLLLGGAAVADARLARRLHLFARMGYAAVQLRRNGPPNEHSLTIVSGLALHLGSYLKSSAGLSSP